MSYEEEIKKGAYIDGLGRYVYSEEIVVRVLRKTEAEIAELRAEAGCLTTELVKKAERECALEQDMMELKAQNEQLRMALLNCHDEHKDYYIGCEEVISVLEKTSN